MDDVWRQNSIQQVTLRWHSFFLWLCMKHKDPEAIVPHQHKGTEKNITHTVHAVDDNDARRLFMIARNRLVDVNHWHEWSSPAHFHLVDKEGNPLDRTAEKGDMFAIDIKAPGPREGFGRDWVFIESVDDHSDPDRSEEHMAIRVRPAPNPRSSETSNTAHFFTDDATSTFIVSRKGKDVIASVFGRNEVPNTTTSDIVDKVRNAVVAISAIAGLSEVQWNSLVKGLLTMS